MLFIFPLTDLKFANEIVERKCSYSNSEASELDKKKDKLQKKRDKKRENNKMDESFNSMFDEEV